MRCAIRVAEIVPCNSPDNSGVIVTFLSGQVEGRCHHRQRRRKTRDHKRLSRLPGVPMSLPTQLLSQHHQKVSIVHWAKTFASSCLRGRPLQETTLDFRDIGEGSERVPLGTREYFPASLARGWALSQLCTPYFTSVRGQDPVHSAVPTLDCWDNKQQVPYDVFRPNIHFGKTVEFPNHLDHRDWTAMELWFL